MRRLMFILVCGVLILSSLALASAASAKTTVEVGADYRLAVTETLDSGSLAAAGCRTVTVGYTKANGGIGPTSNDLYKIFQRQGWCWNTEHTKVTDLYGHSKWKECCDPGWQWVSWEKTVTNGSPGSNYTITRRIEGHTKFCIPLVGCSDHDHPFIKLYLNGDGGYGVHKGDG